MRLQCLVHQRCGDLGRKATRTNLLGRFEQVFCRVVERALTRNDLDRRQRLGGAIRALQHATGRFDAGNKLELLEASIEFALRRPDLGPPLRAFLDRLPQRV